MFVGTVINAMIDSTAEMIIEDRKTMRENKKKVIDQEISILTNPSTLYHSDRERKRTIQTIKLIFSGKSILEDRLKLSNRHIRSSYLATQIKGTADFLCRSLHLFYVWLVDTSEFIVENSLFQNFVVFVILIACCEVGLETKEDLALKLSGYLFYLDQFILAVFTFEVAVKFLAEGPMLYTYFHNNWNKFDFFIVLVCYLPTSNRNLVMMLRLLRLLRILKLLRAFPKLQVVVIAILSSLTSIFYIGIILLLFFYFYAIIGMTLFASNDPWRFGSLHMAMLTLFQTVTFDNWTPVELTQLYGCAAPVWVYGTWFSGCDDSHGNFSLGFIYFYSFAIIGGFILLALFIGVVNVYMDISGEDLKRQSTADMKVRDFAAGHGLDKYTINLYRDAFEVIDFAKSGFVGFIELKVGLEVAENAMTETELQKLETDIVQNHDGKYDFYEFVKFIVELKQKRVTFRKNSISIRKKPEPVPFSEINHFQNKLFLEDPSTVKIDSQEMNIDYNSFSDDRISADQNRTCTNTKLLINTENKVGETNVRVKAFDVDTIVHGSKRKKPIPPVTLSPIKVIEMRQRQYGTKLEEKRYEVMLNENRSQKKSTTPTPPQTPSPEKVIENRRKFFTLNEYNGNGGQNVVNVIDPLRDPSKTIETFGMKTKVSNQSTDFSKPYNKKGSLRDTSVARNVIIEDFKPLVTAMAVKMELFPVPSTVKMQTSPIEDSSSKVIVASREIKITDSEVTKSKGNNF